MCQNNNLEDLVRSVIGDFIQADVLFTALDVSNKVKETLPWVRHREIRDAVRNCWTSDIEPAGYGRTPITVTLADGSTDDALLYHPLADSLDLDAKYDYQKRAQVAAHASTNAPTPVTVGNQVISLDPNGSVNISPTVQVAATTPVPAPKPVIAVVQAQNNARDLWDQLFKTQPSLFPRKVNNE